MSVPLLNLNDFLYTPIGRFFFFLSLFVPGLGGGWVGARRQNFPQSGADPVPSHHNKTDIMAWV